MDAVITSPPYPNEKDYTRTTRLESVLLGFLTDRASLRRMKEGLLRSNTRNVYKDDDDDRWIADHPGSSGSRRPSKPGGWSWARLQGSNACIRG